MRLPVFIAGILCLCVSITRAADDEDQAAVRMHAERYMGALLRQDKATLDALVHERYEGHSVLGPSGVRKRNKVESIAYWTNPNTRFTRLVGKVESVRVFGDTAIEVGTLYAEQKVYGEDTTWFGILSRRKEGSSTWADVAYSRIWVKEGKDWRLVHEQD